jgi:hypothetical protein
MGVACSTYGESRVVYKVLTGKPEGKRLLGRPRPRWENNIKMDHQEMGCVSTDRIDLAQDRDRWRALVNEVMNFQVPYNGGNFLTSFSKRTLLHGVSKWVINNIIIFITRQLGGYPVAVLSTINHNASFTIRSLQPLSTILPLLIKHIYPNGNLIHPSIH